MKVKAPAKINIGLNIVRKRQDGYHDLETLFYPLKNLYDVILIEESKSLEIFTDSSVLKTREDNLIYGAVKLLSEEIGKEINVKINLEKNIPIGGGLGGGSSDAAATLIATNKFLNLGISLSRLAELALQLGSDVPFFLEAQPAFGFSRGEILQKARITIDLPILLVNPNIHISTSEAFSKITPLKPEQSLKNIISGFPHPNFWKGRITNDFENILFDEFPILKNIKSQLYASGALFALMSGTGSTVYGIFNDKGNAVHAQQKFSNHYWTKIV